MKGEQVYLSRFQLIGMSEVLEIHNKALLELCKIDPDKYGDEYGWQYDRNYEIVEEVLEKVNNKIEVGHEKAKANWWKQLRLNIENQTENNSFVEDEVPF